MGPIVEQSPTVAPVSIGEAKAFLRIANSEEDALLAGLVRSAAQMCEAFTGLVLIEREMAQVIPASSAWTKIGATPVRSIGGVAAIAADGVETALAAASYAVDIDANGDGWVRLTGAVGAGRLKVGFTAGLAADWNGIPEALRQGIVRLAAHLYTERDDAEGKGPPCAVSALWRPWRRMQFGHSWDRRPS